MAIAVADQLEGKLDYEQVYNAKHLLNPIELTGENIVVSFDKRADNHIAVEVKKTTTRLMVTVSFLSLMTQQQSTTDGEDTSVKPFVILVL